MCLVLHLSAKGPNSSPPRPTPPRAQDMRMHNPTICLTSCNAATAPVQGDTRSYSTYVATRPPAMEQSAIRALVEVLDADSSPAKPGFRVHIAHLADAGSLPLIQVCAFTT
jgi:hypothetical protein